MIWWQTILIVYGAIGFIFGLLIALIGNEGESITVKILIIPICVVIGGGVMIMALIDWIFDL